MIWESLRVRLQQGWPFIPDPRAAMPAGYRGLPVVTDVPCAAGCTACLDECPTEAIVIAEGRVQIDLGRCVYCGRCEEVCPVHAFKFTADPKQGGRSLGDLVVTAGTRPTVARDVDLARIFGRSLKLRQVSAGGCNACELELSALANVNFDVQRYGIEWVASPRHADALVLTGPLTEHMRDAVRLTWEAMPDPKFVVAFGACAISGGLYREGHIDRAFLGEHIPALYLPGCPPHPLTFVHGILDLLGVR